MKISLFHRLLLRLGIAIVLMVLVSASWSPHLLKGNELLLVQGGVTCHGGKDCEDSSCPGTCNGSGDKTCTKSAPATTGCWGDLSGNACGQVKKTGADCGGDMCGNCNPC